MVSNTTTTPVQNLVPRPSASVIIVNSRNEVLLVHRNPEARHFGGVHVCIPHLSTAYFILDIPTLGVSWRKL